MKSNNKTLVISFSRKENDQEVYLRNIVDNYDWVYSDNDRTFELFQEIDKDNPSKGITIFVDYVSGKFNFTRKEKEIFDYFIRTVNLNNKDCINDCINKINNDFEDDILEFLIKYNFRIKLIYL